MIVMATLESEGGSLNENIKELDDAQQLLGLSIVLDQDMQDTDDKAPFRVRRVVGSYGTPFTRRRVEGS